MKRKHLLVKLFPVITLALCATLPLVSQQTEKELEKAIKDKAIKEARKEAKALEKEGWYVAPGSLPLEKVVENAWMKQYQSDDAGNTKYITADGNAVAQSKSVADMQSIELAKLQLAGLVQTNVSSLVDANLGNAQLSAADAASVTEIVQSSKNLIATELGYVNPVFKIYRDLPGDNVEAQVRLFYDVKQSMEIAKKVVQKDLKEKLQINSEQLEKLMGL